MTLQVCGEPGCPELLPRGTQRCNTHRLRDTRPTRQQRGYDRVYDAYARSAEYLSATHCGTCGEPFTEDNPRTIGHSIAIRNGGIGSPLFPQCRRENYGWRRSGA